MGRIELSADGAEEGRTVYAGAKPDCDVAIDLGIPVGHVVVATADKGLAGRDRDVSVDDSARDVDKTVTAENVGAQGDIEAAADQAAAAEVDLVKAIAGVIGKIPRHIGAAASAECGEYA